MMEVDYQSTAGSTEQRVRELLEEWRSRTISQLGIQPDQFDWCCRNSKVMHDIYVDAIAKSASNIHSLDDFKKVAQYWRLLEDYGDEVFEAIRDELIVSKRLCENRTECDKDMHKDYRRVKRQRIRA
jgi:hypothetical protein